MKAYLYENDPDWMPLYLLSEQPRAPEDTEYQMSDKEWQKYLEVVTYVEDLHKRLERWHVRN